MKRILLTTITALAVSLSPTHAEEPERDYASLVNPFIGTDYTGNVYPGAQMPHGMVQLSPDNGLPGWDRIAGYFYPDSTIAGFSHTHLSGTGAGDMYDISFLPVTRPMRVASAPLGVHSRFSHDSEKACAGYYSVHLDDYDIQVELTTTERCGVQRYTYPDTTGVVLLNLAKAMNWDATTDTRFAIVDERTIEGYRFSSGWARQQQVFFRTRFSRPIKAVQVDSAMILTAEGAWRAPGIVTLEFGLDDDRQLSVITAISGTGLKGAALNLAHEAPHDDFDAYRAAAHRRWNSELGRIEAVGENHDRLVCFYTALYRTMLAPTLYCDIDGLYRGADGKNHMSDGWLNYSTFSLWDTYRATHPLYTLIAPHRVSDMVNSFIAFFEEHGRLPVWNMWGGETDMMIGYHAVAVIAEAMIKGIAGFDREKAFRACVATADDDGYRGIGLYKKSGYIPYDVPDSHNSDNWALSRTLEYAFDDHCIARMAEQLGHDSVAGVFHRRAQNYRNVYNPHTTFMQPRNSSGTFQPAFDPEEYTPHICESNAWHYLWSVQHDIKGLMELLGRDRFTAKLDSLFCTPPTDSHGLPIFSTGMIGQYVHGNEPCHHVIYLYNHTDKPYKTQEYAARVMRELYRNSPDGLCGNEDCGQMSAWYLFSAMGFYPVNPVSGEYELGTPLFPEVRLHLDGGRTFTIKAPEADDKNIYIESVSLNGIPLKKSHITHNQITEGGTLEFNLSRCPRNIRWDR